MTVGSAVEQAHRYANDVVSGNLPACAYVRQACQRHLDDLDKQQNKAFNYRFDENKAEAVCRFIQMLPHTKGEWALKRQDMVLEPWQLFILTVAFGWVHQQTGLRRFRLVWKCLARMASQRSLPVQGCTC